MSTVTMPCAERRINNSTELRPPRLQVREHEILRISGISGRTPIGQILLIARTTVLKWVQARTVGRLPEPAWSHESFDHLAGGRDCSAVRLHGEGEDIWVLRAEDPDKTVAGRIWTSEIAIVKEPNQDPRFTLRLAVGSTEPTLTIEPHVPGVVLQLIQSPGLSSGKFQHLSDKPVVIRSEQAVQLLINALLDPARKLPVIALSVSSTSSDPDKPSLDAVMLAKACAGLALVVVIPAQYSWAFTERFGKKLSVYEGAARGSTFPIYRGRKPLWRTSTHTLAVVLATTQAMAVLTHLRWIAANGSVRRLQLGTDVFFFRTVQS